MGWVWFCYVYNLLCLGPKGPGHSNKEKPESWLGLEPKEMRALLLADLLTVKVEMLSEHLNSVKPPHLLFCYCPLLKTRIKHPEFNISLPLLSTSHLQEAKHLKRSLGQGSNFLRMSVSKRNDSSKLRYII